MEEDHFVAHYLKPSVNGLNREFTLPLPDIPGIKQSGTFIVQGSLDNTVSTNSITKYVSAPAGVRCVEVYKNTEDAVAGKYIRLVGTLSLVKKGYPFLFLDAAVSNICFTTGQTEGLTTRVAIHLPQADGSVGNIFFDTLAEQAKSAGLTPATRGIASMPEFWGPFLRVQHQGIACQVIRLLRDAAWKSYERYCSEAGENPDFDYRPVQHQMILKTSQAEHQFFRKMGLAVAPEAQAAFFSVLAASLS